MATRLMVKAYLEFGGPGALGLKLQDMEMQFLSGEDFASYLLFSPWGPGGEACDFACPDTYFRCENLLATVPDPWWDTMFGDIESTVEVEIVDCEFEVGETDFFAFQWCEHVLLQRCKFAGVGDAWGDDAAVIDVGLMGHHEADVGADSLLEILDCTFENAGFYFDDVEECESPRVVATGNSFDPSVGTVLGVDPHGVPQIYCTLRPSFGLVLPACPWSPPNPPQTQGPTVCKTHTFSGNTGIDVAQTESTLVSGGVHVRVA